MDVVGGLTARARPPAASSAGARRPGPYLPGRRCFIFATDAAFLVLPRLTPSARCCSPLAWRVRSSPTVPAPS